jgi:cation diffusion facilitator CzcD-associated flavoprotein CzcO
MVAVQPGRDAMEHFDVIIVGAGLSGVDAAWHLKKQAPKKSFTILEGRGAIGGTWDLFRYPGIRSDSDMYTLGYGFKPWRGAKAIADGPSIRAYVREAAAENGIDRKIRFHHLVKRANWSSADARWTVECEAGPEKRVVRLTCGFLFMCSGYYRYDEGHRPHFEDEERFQGKIVHPQFWPEDLDYKNKKVVVIGSGATAMTLVPEMAKDAVHVTMLQRSPTYVVSRPAEDKLAERLKRYLPAKLAYAIMRWNSVLFGIYFYNLTRKKPQQVKDYLLKLVREQLGADYDVKTHFTPSYNPWDQRLCLVPDGDLFHSIREGRASVVTDRIERFTEKGVRLASGQELEADIIVTATGLKVTTLGNAEVSVDGKRIETAQTMTYKGMMYSDVPNLASIFGYTNASWTLKADLTCEYVCRMLNFMDRHGYVQATPRRNDPSVVEEPYITFSSGYIQRAEGVLPRQGDKRPWKLYQNYARDLLMLRFGKIDDGTMEFRKAPAKAHAKPEEMMAAE